MIQGFEQAQTEYEAKMFDPFCDEEQTMQNQEEYYTDEIEEMMLERGF